MDADSATGEVYREIADLACDYAYENASMDLRSLRGGRASFYPIVDYDEEEIGVGVNPDYHYLIYQNNGFASYAMKSCIGKTIPISTPNGLIFRKCTGVGQWRSGLKNYWTRTADGELISEWRQARAWTHPGLGPKRFIDDAVDDAIEEKQDDLDEAILYDAYGEIEEQLDRDEYGARY